MSKWYGVAAMAALLAPLGASAQPAMTYFKLSSNPDFDKYRPALIDYLRSEHFHKATSFCVVGMKDDSSVTAEVIWMDGRQIIDWDGNYSKLAQFTPALNLKTDVVPTEDDLHGSTYLVTRKWVKDQLTICKRDGEMVRVSAAELRR